MAVIACAAVGCLLLIDLASAGDVDARHQQLDPATTKARLLRVQSKYAVWLLSQLDPKTAMRMRPTYIHRFYRQRLDEQKGNLIYQLVRIADGGHMVAVRDDGSMLLERGEELHFVPIAGPPLIENLRGLVGLTVHSDGLLAIPAKDPKKFYPVYFVPFDGERLRFDNRIEIVGAGVKRFEREDRFETEEGIGYPVEPYRFGDILAWVVDSTLHTFNLKSYERKAVKLAGKHHPSCCRISAFDGATVVLGRSAFDAVTGDLLAENRRCDGIGFVFAVRNRIGYYYAAGGLRATDLTAKDGASIHIQAALPIVPGQSAAGLTVWDGKRWTLVPWLKSLQRP